MQLDVSWLRRRLLSWFDKHRRDLPWRKNRDPYHIWISEVMLQQTTVAAAQPYFQRFVAAFPTLHDLARASERDVLQIWAGLGYYRRARHLHQAARLLATRYPSHLPDDPAIWSQLPGVGRYILGAVLSQAFDRRMPIIEANSLRVLCRLFAYSGDPRSASGQKWLWQTAEKSLPVKRVGDYNQSLMELGALVCTPSNPQCLQCPLRTRCQAHSANLQEQIPRKPKRPAIIDVREVALAIRKGNRLLLVERPPNASRWAGMWELPHGEMLADESPKAAARRLLKSLTGLRADVHEPVCHLKHGVTRFRIAITCYAANAAGGRFASTFYRRGRWLSPKEWELYPISNPQRQLLRGCRFLVDSRANCKTAARSLRQ